MTRAEFESKHRANVKQGFDTLDGKEVWKEFKADLTELLDSERKRLAVTAGNAREDCKFGDTHGHCECSFWAQKAVENDAK